MNIEPITVRRARMSDQPHLAALGETLDDLHLTARPDLFHRPPSPARGLAWAAAFTGPDAAGFVAEKNDELLGFALVRRRQPAASPFAAGGSYAELEEIVVAPRCRHGGVGRALVDSARAWAEAQGLGRLVVQAFAFNRDALGFYESMGFAEMTRRLEMKLTHMTSDQAPWT